jgi:hypothetical protein
MFAAFGKHNFPAEFGKDRQNEVFLWLKSG